MPPDNSKDTNTLLGFPINRVVAFLTPFTVIIAGKVGLWLFANVGFFNTFNINHEKISTAIVQIFAFAIPAVLTYMTHHHFLTGWQRWESPPAAPVTVVTTAGAGETVDTETDVALDPPSDEELADTFPGSPGIVAGVPLNIEPEGDVTKFGEGAASGKEADAS